jgi:putative Mg2+ transporter-C (MgtC) family protein
VFAAGGQSVADALREEFADLANFGQACRLAVRLLVALALGSLLGYEREHVGKPAGLRTHMLVALGAALVTAAVELADLGVAEVGRAVQGLAAGVGFIGGGAILKLSEDKTIRGLTTAASLWVAAGVGITAGLGRYWAAVLGGALGFLVLAGILRLELLFERNKDDPGDRK